MISRQTKVYVSFIFIIIIILILHYAIEILIFYNDQSTYDTSQHRMKFNFHIFNRFSFVCNKMNHQQSIGNG